MRWLTRKLTRWLLGPAAIDGITDELLNEIELAIAEQFALVMAQDTP